MPIGHFPSVCIANKTKHLSRIGLYLMLQLVWRNSKNSYLAVIAHLPLAMDWKACSPGITAWMV